MEADLIVDLFELIGRQLERGPKLGVLRIGKRHDRVQPVVASGELDHYQDRVFGPLLIGQGRGQCRPTDESRYREPQRHQTSAG